MRKIEIYFDGYCPESLLKGNQVEMRLNEDDFWESEATGLQISVFPPYAVILDWRGKRKFRSSSGTASNLFTGLIMTEPQAEEGKEIFPDEDKILHDAFEIDRHTGQLYKSKEEMDAAKFNPGDPVFETQKQYLNTLSKQDLGRLIELQKLFTGNGYGGEFAATDTFEKLHETLYELKLIFNFKWMAWNSGWKNINDTNFDYSNSSLLDLSMYLTAIFRQDRFCDGTIEGNFKNGTLDKIFNKLKDYI